VILSSILAQQLQQLLQLKVFRRCVKALKLSMVSLFQLLAAHLFQFLAAQRLVSAEHIFVLV